MTASPHRTIIVPGSGVIVRWPDAVVVIGDEETAAVEVVAFLTGERTEPPAAGMLIERIRSLDAHDLAAAVVTPAGLRLLRHGAGRAQLLDATIVASTARAGAVSAVSSASQEFDIDVTATPLWIGIGDPPDVTSDHSLFDLGAGIVPGRGVVLDASQRSVAPTPSPSPFDLVDFGAQAEAQRAPLPEAGQSAEEPVATAGGQQHDNDVLGIECSRGHFNNPIAAYCQVCGISMVHLTHHLVPGTRPTLGYIVFDNGATYALDRPYVIGREPTAEPGSGLEPLIADDIDHTVSRDHAELTFDGWNVVVADVGSTNGTFHWDAATARWERIMPNHPVVIAPGVSVALGRTTFVYETVARSI